MMFKRFYTSDSSRSGKNTGLGLTISKHLAENMGGKLYAELESKDDTHWLKIVFEIQCHFE